MFDAATTDREIIAYRLKLIALGNRYLAGERSTVRAEAQDCSDALICLMEEAPIEKRQTIDHLIDRFEALRISSLS